MNATEKYNHITTFQIALVKMNKKDTHINGIQNGWFNIKVKWDECYLAFVWYWRCFDSSYKVVYSGKCRLSLVEMWWFFFFYGELTPYFQLDDKYVHGKNISFLVKLAQLPK